MKNKTNKEDLRSLTSEEKLKMFEVEELEPRLEMLWDNIECSCDCGDDYIAVPT